MNKRQKKMAANENYQNSTDRNKCFRSLPPVNGKQMLHQKLKTEKRRKYTRTDSLCKLKQMFRKSQEGLTQNEVKLWKVTQEKSAKYIMFK
jgi:hypothetical protein